MVGLCVWRSRVVCSTTGSAYPKCVGGRLTAPTDVYSVPAQIGDYTDFTLTVSCHQCGFNCFDQPLYAELSMDSDRLSWPRLVGGDFGYRF